MKRTGLQLFYAAPSGAWRLGELTFCIHVSRLTTLLMDSAIIPFNKTN